MVQPERNLYYFLTEIKKLTLHSEYTFHSDIYFATVGNSASFSVQESLLNFENMSPHSPSSNSETSTNKKQLHKC